MYTATKSLSICEFVEFLNEKERVNFDPDKHFIFETLSKNLAEV